VFPWPLANVGGPIGSGVASLAVLGGLLASRLLLLPAGPWEQDEALLACGVVDFDPARHMPLPPGFPLWVFIGKVIRHLVAADPVRALQLASAVASVAGIWALVGLWDEVAGRRLALAGGALAAFLPGVWFHAGRAFSETPSAVLAVVGFGFWARGGRKGFVPGVVAMTAAALVRPPLAPFFLLAVVLATWWVRRELRRVAAGIAAGAAVLALVMAPAVLAAGGWRLLLDVSMIHAGEHFSTLGTEPWSFASLGFVRGLGAPAVAAAFAVLAGVGWAGWRRRLGGAWGAGTLAGATLLFLVVLVDNRTYPRYWVLVWLLLATPVVAGLARLLRSTAAGAAVAACAALAAGVWTLPAVRYIHRHELPAMALLNTVAHEGRGVLIFEDQLFSFRNLAAMSGSLGIESFRLTELERAAPGIFGAPTWLLAEGDGEDLACLASTVVRADCSQPRVERLSQERFLHLRLVRDPLLVASGGSFPEWEGTHRFVWCRANTKLVAPPVDGSGTLALAVEVHPKLGEVGLEARVNGAPAWRARLAPGFHVVSIPIPAPAEKRSAVRIGLRAERELRSTGDGRPQAFRILGASLQAPPLVLPPLVFFPEVASMFGALAEGSGTYTPELLGNPPRPAAWTGAHAEFWFPAGAGLVGLDLLAPRSEPAVVTVHLGSSAARATVGHEPSTIALPVPPELVGVGRVRLQVDSTTQVPGGADTRALGVAIGRIWYLPTNPVYTVADWARSE
jgi:hypothetical protein